MIRLSKECYHVTRNLTAVYFRGYRSNRSNFGSNRNIYHLLNGPTQKRFSPSLSATLGAAAAIQSYVIHTHGTMFFPEAIRISNIIFIPALE